MSDSGEAQDAAERVFQRQRKLRFADLPELFFARVLLGLIENPLEEKTVTVGFDLGHLFPQHSFESIVGQTSVIEFQESNRMAENMVDFLNGLQGTSLVAATRTTTVLNHYADKTHSALSYLRDGDGMVLPSTIASFRRLATGRFEVTCTTTWLTKTLGESIEKRLQLVGKFVTSAQPLVPEVGARIDYGKQLDLLVEFLRDRQQVTGEKNFSFTTREIPFRQAIWTQGKAAMPSPGTCGPSEKILLPLFLEASGIIDITHVGLISSPKQPTDIELKYAINMPAQVSIFGASSQGLSPEDRRRLSEIELSIYARLHRKLQKHYVFAGRPSLERSFGELASWTLRKVAFCLEDPAFVNVRAKEWLTRHDGEKQIRMEDEFFLPLIQERLQEAFGDRVKKKPEMYGGKADLFLDDIPIELKVRRGHSKPLPEVVNSDYQPVGQTSAYASKTRVGFVFVLDLPDGQAYTTNLDSCFRILERDPGADAGSDLPTCVVVAVFHCHHAVPSRIR